MARRVGSNEVVGLGVNIHMGVVGGAKSADTLNRATRSIEGSIKRANNAVTDYQAKIHALNKAYITGGITKQKYEQIYNSLAFREQKRIGRIEKERAAVLGLDKAESLLERKRRDRARMAGMAASGASGLGFGGKGAGAARFLGGVAGLGGNAMAIGAGFGGLALVKESITAFADLEAKVAGLKTLFGEDLGLRLTEQFRELAKTTILTNNQLIENARTWASYGLTTENLTDRLRRLGTVAGGNSEKFRALTIAFAQVNAQGKLMGQEKNQLINAGFSLQAVAEQAGISMTEFADAMKNGEITAEHLNKALISVTNEGGLFAGYLEKQADTISGKMTVLQSTWEEFLQTLGSAEKGPAADFLDKMIEAAEAMTRAARFLDGQGPDLGVGAGTKGKQAGKATGSSLLGAAGGAAQVENQFDLNEIMGMFGGVAKAAGPGTVLSSTLIDVGKYTGLIEKDFVGSFEEVIRTIEHDVNKAYGGAGPYANRDMQSRSKEAQAEADRQREEQRKKDEQLFESAMQNVNLNIEMFDKILSQIQSPGVKSRMERQRMFVPGGMAEDKSFADKILLKKVAEEEKAYKEEQEIRRLKKEAVIEEKLKNVDVVFEREMERLDREQKLAQERSAIDKKLAAGPSQKDAYFEGGSVGEFQFLRKSKQENETAKAIREAEDRASRQREEIARQRKEAEEEAKQQRQQLIQDQAELGINIGV